MKQWTIPIISAMVGLLAFTMTHIYLREKEEEYLKRKAELESRYQTVPVVVAGEDIPANTKLRLDQIGAKKFPRASIQQNAILAVDQKELVKRLIGKRVKFSLKKGDPIRWSDLDLPRRPVGGLSSKINKDLQMRAVSIAVGGNNAVSSLIQVNDRVDVLGTFSFPTAVEGELETITLTILQDVSVLAVGQEFEQSMGSDYQQRSRQRGYSTVTLQVTPSEAELLVFAENSKGRLTLTLRNPEDGSYLDEKGLNRVNFNHLQQKIPDYNRIRQTDIRERDLDR
jgi:pilus assembly protein CpaB